MASAGFISAITDMFGNSSSTDLSATSSNSQNMALLQATVNLDPHAGLGGTEVIIEDQTALAHEASLTGGNEIDKPTSDQISVYEVRKGDSLAGIAKMFGVSVNTIKWSNDIEKGITEGDVLTILPISGVTYTIKNGDSLQVIAKKYKADIDEVLRFNGLTLSSPLIVGEAIVLPDAEPESAPVKKKSLAKIVTNLISKGYFSRPMKSGVKTQGIHGHNGIDIGAPVGATVYAAADGQVIIAKSSGYNGGYGDYVVIKHPNGTQTLYAHLSVVGASYGQQVTKGQVIGAVGNTGKSTGPHLHFEIRGAVNPF